MTSISYPASDFIGRQPELAVLTAAVDNALSGRGQMVMLAGEPGIGKTRLAQELISRAESLGAQVMLGRCHEEQGVPPYWPWIQAIRSRVNDSDPEQLRSEMGTGAAEIAEIVADIKERLPNVGPPPKVESPEQAQFRLFDSITTFLKTASQTQPLVLFLDDLHWADQPSLSLLRFAAKELGSHRLLLLGTYRDVDLNRRHPLAETLGELTRERLFQRVQLRGLPQEDVARLIEITSGNSIPPGLVEAVHSQTDGNALFVTEVVRMLAQEGDLNAESVEETDTWTIRIPEGVREVIGRRLNRLSEGCNQALTVASIVGREFTLDQLWPSMEDPPAGPGPAITRDFLLEALEEASAGRVIEEMGETVGRYQFTHALVQETLSSELSLTQRVRLHARVAESLETLYGLEAEAHAAELAHHFVQAQTVTGVEKVVRYSLAAGYKAVNVRAYDEALTHFERGLTAKGVRLTGLEPAEDDEAAALLLGLGNAQLGTFVRSSTGQVAETLTRAFDYYVSVGDSERAVTVALSDLPVVAVGVEFIERALALVPPDSHDAGKLKARLIIALRPDYDRSDQTFRDTLSIAREHQDKSLEMQALVAGACVDFHHGRNEQSLERNLQAIDLAEMVDLPNEESHARFDLYHILYAMGDLEGATHHAEAMVATAERTQTRIWRGRAMDANAILCSAKGDWQAARKYIEHGLEGSPQDSVILGAGALLEYQLGESEAGGAYLRRLLESVPEGSAGPPYRITESQQVPYLVPAVVIPVIAYITGHTAHLDLVEAIAQSEFSVQNSIPNYLHAADIGAALLAVLRRDETAAGELYGVLQSISGTMAPQSNVGIGLSVDRLLGLLSQTLGDSEQAAVHFEDALAFCRRAGYRPELAWTCCDYADTLLERNGDGDVARARSLLDESLTISIDLGMRPLMERVAMRKEKTGELPDQKPAFPDGLTQREVEVLKLICGGKTDREIGEELFISFRTVGNHVRSILSKTGAANRAEATNYANQHGLVKSSSDA